MFHNFIDFQLFESEEGKKETKEKSRLSLSIADWYSILCTVSNEQVTQTSIITIEQKFYELFM